MAKFSSWRRPRLLHESTRVGTRLGRTLSIRLIDSTAPESPAASDIALVFKSAADVAQLTEQAIRHRAPAPGVADAETTKATHVDFHSPDLPWRYTPEGGDEKRLRPWLALIVGDGDEVRVSGTTVTLSPRLLAEDVHDLDTSWRWAHVHGPSSDSEGIASIGDRAADRLSRLLSLRPLKAHTTYTAAIVPTFNARGENLWDRKGRVHNDDRPIPLLASWSFTTGEGGDFETLAAELRVPPAADIGKASLTYRIADEPIGPVQVRGALQSLQSVQEAAPGQDLVAQQVALAAVQAAGSPELLGLPDYGLPWIADPHDKTAGWVNQLRTDARVRIHAGTGTWTGVEAQDALMAAAVEQAGALPDASALIARAAVGVAASGNQWGRALPADPVQRLAVLSPLLTRMAAGDGRVVASDALTGPTHNLDASVLTSTGRRLLSRSARTDRTANTSVADLLQAANEPPPAPDPEESARRARWAEQFPDDGGDRYRTLRDLLDKLRLVAAGARSRYLVDVLPEATAKAAEVSAPVRAAAVTSDDLEKARALERAVFDDIEVPALDALIVDLEKVARDLLSLAERCGEDVFSRAARLAGAADWAALLRQLVRSPYATDLIYGSVQSAVLACLLGCPELDEPGSRCAKLIAILRIPAVRHLAPIVLPQLADNLATAIDPRTPEAPVIRSLHTRIPDLLWGSLAPPRYPLGLNFPTWSLLHRYAPDWLLPGSQTVAKHSITALRTNPTFIDAYLVGLNSQFLSEVRWRGLQVDRWGTPLRMFFAPVDARTGERTPDIIPIESWPEGSSLGARSHQATAAAAHDADGADRLVLLFNSPLFRRYPRTLVYLQKRTDDEDGDAAEMKKEPVLVPPVDATPQQLDDWYRNRQYLAPSFTGSISPDLVFFLFDVAPAHLGGYYLVLDEPPSELRFRHDRPYAEEAPSSAHVASALVDERTRVVIDGMALEQEGLNSG